MAYIIFFRGVPGVGKSTVARRLGVVCQIPILDYDDVKGELVAVLQNPELPRISYDIIANILRSNISSGVSVIFDSHGYYQEAFNKCVAIVGLDNVIVVECHCSDEFTWTAHLLERKDGAKASQLNERHLVKESSKKMEPIFPKYHISIDTVHPIDWNVAEIVAYLKEIKKL